MKRAVVLRLCSWHQREWGYPRVLGVASWVTRGARFQTSHGICGACARRVHARRFGLPLPPASVGRELLRLGAAAFACVSWVVAAVVVFGWARFAR